MFSPFFLFVGHRYTRVKRKNHFISFISITSMLGIALGVAVLITVLSVMNGFSKEIRGQMLSVAPHITLRDFGGDLSSWRSVLKEVLKHPEIVGATPYINAHGMLVEQGKVQPVLVRGIEPKELNFVYPLENNMLHGDLDALLPGAFSVVLGRDLAQSLGVWVGDKVTLMAPEVRVTLAGMIPRIKRLEVVGIFSSGTNYDNRHAFMHLEDASKVYRMANNVSGIQIRVKDDLRAGIVARELSRQLDYKYWLPDWTTEFEHFFEAVKMEKTVMWCILLLIIAVAAFNLVSSLVMVVTDKRTDIAILRTMGASKRSIMGIFMVQGSIIGVVGTILGIIFGLLLAVNVTAIVEFVQQIFNVKFISEDVYFGIGYVPSDIQQGDVIWVSLISLVMSLIATIYPALRAGRIAPAEALRYE
jgi:lipoprotein-releasing system permease protein